MSHLENLQDLTTVVETAKQRLEAGEKKAHRAGDLLVRAENLREKAQAREEEAKKQIAAGEEKLAEARQLRPVVDDETIAQAEELVERIRSEARADIEQLLTEAEEAKARANELAADPDVQAFLEHQEQQERAEREARAQARKELETRLDALESAEEIEALAEETEEAGFADLAARARDAAKAARREARREAERARRKAQAQARMEKKRRKRRFFRWAQRRAEAAQAGDFIFVLEFPGETMGKAVHLRPLPANSGRIRFQVVEAWQMNGQAPKGYSDLSAQGRTWEWRQAPAGTPEGLDRMQAEFTRRLCRNRIPGWKINRENARLAEMHEPEEPEEEAAETNEPDETVLIDDGTVQVTVKPVEDDGDEDEDESEGAHQAASQEAEEQSETTEQDTQDASEGDELQTTDVEPGDLAGLSARVQGRLRRAGLTDRQMVADVLSAGEEVFLDLSGIGPQTLEAVRQWLADDEAERPAGEEPGDEPEAESEADAEMEEAEGEGLEGLPSRAATLLRDAGLETVEDVAEVLAEDGDVLLAIDGIGPKTLEAVRDWLAEKLAVSPVGRNHRAAGEIEVEASETSQQEEPDSAEGEAPAITVVGDGLSGQKLAQWRGAARVGLKSLDVEEVQLLVGRENGLVTVMVEWPGGETTLSHPTNGNGRSTQMNVIGKVAQQIRGDE